MNLSVLVVDTSLSPDQILEGYGFQTALFNRMLGVQRIYIECADDPAQAEDLCKQYLDLVKNLSESIRSVDNFDPSNPTSALRKCFEVFNGELGRKYGNSTLLSDAISKNSWDCDNSAFLFYDAVRMAQVSGVEMVFVPRHCLLKSGAHYFESTSGHVQTKEETEKLYGRIDWEGTDSNLLFGLMFNQTGVNELAQHESKSMSLIRIGATLGYSQRSYYATAAKIAFDEGNQELCAEFLSAASGVVDGLNPETLFQLGEMRLKIGLWEEALADFSEVTSVEPYSMSARLKQVYLNMKLESWNGALEALLKHLQHTTSSETLIQIGFQLPEYRMSIQDIPEESIHAESKVAFHLMRAVVATSTGNRELTASELKKAEQYAPEEARIHLFRGMLTRMFTHEVSPEILDEFQKAVDKDPKDEIARLELGRALESKVGIFGSADDKAKVIYQFEAALSTNPENDHTNNQLATLYLEVDNAEKAISLLQTPRSSEKLETMRYELLADAQLKMGDAGAAYENYTIAKVRKLTSGAENDLEERLGDCAVDLNKFRLARRHYKAAMEERESSFGSFIKAVEATTGATHSTKSDITNYKLLLKYGMACVGCRSHDEAISALTRYIDSKEGTGSFDVFAYQLRGIAYHEKGDLDKARNDLQKFLAAPGDIDPANLKNAEKRIKAINEGQNKLVQGNKSPHLNIYQH